MRRPDAGARASALAIVGLGAGLAAGSWLAIGPAIAGGVQAAIGFYEAVAPVFVFAILGPSLLRLLRHDRGETRRFALYAVAWFSGLRLAVCAVATGVVACVFRLPFGASVFPSDWTLSPAIAQNRYLLTFAAACVTAWLLRHRQGRAVDRFLAIPDAIEAIGNTLTRLTLLFGFLIGIAIVSLPDMLVAATNGLRDATPHPIAFGWWTIDPGSAGGSMRVYLAVTGLTALLCWGLHGALIAGAKTRIPGFSIVAYLKRYLLPVYPLIWSTGAESLAIPGNLATLRRYGGAVPDAARDLATALAATLNLNGSLICCLVLLPAVCMAIGHGLTIATLVAVNPKLKCPLVPQH